MSDTSFVSVPQPISRPFSDSADALMMNDAASSSSAKPGETVRPLYAPPHRLATSISTNENGNKAIAERRPFDDSDERIYFDRQSGTWRCEIDGEGDAVLEEVEWNPINRAWVPVLNEEALRAQQAAYSVEGVDEETPAAPVLRRENKRSRNGEASGSKPSKQPKIRMNTSIFVSGLPLDCTKEEIAMVFSRYGVLNEDDAGEARVKMYADERTGAFKGEALITYFKSESVDLAIQLLDESALRTGEGKRDPVMKVQKADFGPKLEGTELNKADHERTLTQGEGSNSSTSQPPKTRTEAEKRKAQKRFAKMNNKLTDWNSDSDSDLETKGSTAPGTMGAGSGIRQVCLRRMFTLAELDEDPSLLLDLKDDVREECETFGKVTNVVLWDKEPEGIMTVRFASHEAAWACVQKMDNRFFGGRKVIAYLLESKPKFKRSGRGQDEDDNDNEEQQKRTDAFGEWLEAGGD